MPEPKLLLSYVRKSIVEDIRTSSPDRQRANIARVTPPGWVNRWYQDLDYSGQSENRPEWQRLLADLVDPNLNAGGVAAESLSRLYRNRTEFEHLKTIILEIGKELVIANMVGVDGRTASGRLLLNIQADVDQFWAEQSSESMRETIYTIVYEKGRHWGPQPFGTDRPPQTKHLIPTTRRYWLSPRTGEAGPLADDEDPPPGAEVRHYHDALRAIFDLYTPERSLQDVADLANADGWRYWGGRGRDKAQPFNREIVYDILQLWELYAGQLPPPRKGKARNRPTLSGGHDPILPVELCERAGATLRARHTAKGPGVGKRTRIYLLSGILFCGECGQRLAGQRVEKGKYYFYRHMYSKGQCSQRMASVEELEQTVIEIIEEIMSAEPIFRLSVERLRAVLLESDDDSDLAELQRRREEHERLIDLHVKGFISRGDFVKRDGPLRAEIERLQKEAAMPVDTAEVDALVDEIMGPMGALAFADPYQQKVLLREFIQGIKLMDGQIAAITPTPLAAPLFELCRLSDGSWSTTESQTIPELAGSSGWHRR